MRKKVVNNLPTSQFNEESLVKMIRNEIQKALEASQKPKARRSHISLLSCEEKERCQAIPSTQPFNFRSMFKNERPSLYSQSALINENSDSALITEGSEDSENIVLQEDVNVKEDLTQTVVSDFQSIPYNLMHRDNPYPSLQTR